MTWWRYESAIKAIRKEQTPQDGLGEELIQSRDERKHEKLETQNNSNLILFSIRKYQEKLGQDSKIPLIYPTTTK